LSENGEGEKSLPAPIEKGSLPASEGKGKGGKEERSPPFFRENSLFPQAKEKENGVSEPGKAKKKGKRSKTEYTLEDN